MAGIDDRLATLACYALLDTPPEPQFDSIVAEAAYQTAAPISIISLVDADREWFKARRGIAAREEPIADSLCVSVIEQDDVFVISDARTDARFQDYATVTGDPGIRFYAGAPLRMRDGARIGALCVIDVEPRAGLEGEEREALQLLARRTVAAMELRRDLIEATGHLRGAAMGETIYLEQANDYLIKASAALDRVGATVPLAHLEQVIASVDALRSASR